MCRMAVVMYTRMSHKIDVDICSRQTQAHCALASSTHKKTAKCLCNFSFVIISECSCPRLSRPLFTCHGTTGSSTQCQAHLTGSSVRDVSSGLSDVMPLPCCCMTTLARHTACLLHAVKTVVWHVLWGMCEKEIACSCKVRDHNFMPIWSMKRAPAWRLALMYLPHTSSRGINCCDANICWNGNKDEETAHLQFPSGLGALWCHGTVDAFLQVQSNPELKVSHCYRGTAFISCCYQSCVITFTSFLNWLFASL